MNNPTSQKNNDNLPGDLKENIETLSGINMDDVKVHFNSSKPAQLDALAYAQGMNTHIGSEEGKHLPSEAWHVAQQKEGRIQPTTQLNSTINVNDDKGLEQEADIMGEKAIKKRRAYKHGVFLL